VHELAAGAGALAQNLSQQRVVFWGTTWEKMEIVYFGEGWSGIKCHFVV